MPHDPDETRVGPPPADDPEETDPRVGTVLAGRYRIVRLLGRGAQGTVYVGEHLKIGRRDAIKVLLPELLSDRDAVARFTRGASNASRISHPNVCTVYDFGDTEDGLPFMASELVEGEELHDVMRREAPFPLERAVDLVDQIAAGLHAAHEIGVVHRDLKPANVMITEGRDGKEVVKVVDFDIAKGMEDATGAGRPLTQAGWIIGTPQYMSPEQITASDLDGRSDTYSLALIFFEMLTGRLPNDVTSTQKLMWQRVNGDFRGLADVMPHASFPPELQGVFDRALAAEREDRPATALDFAGEVRRAVAGGREASGDTPTAAVATPEETVVVSRPEDGAAVGGSVPPTAAEPGAGGRSPRTPIFAGVGVLAVAVLAVAFGTDLFVGGGAVRLIVPPAHTLEVGDSVELSTLVRLEDAETGRPAPGELRYETLRGDVASVDARGALRAHGVGETSIVVWSGSLEDTIALTVMEAVAQAADEPTGQAAGSPTGVDPPDRGPGSETGDPSADLDPLSRTDDTGRPVETESDDRGEPAAGERAEQLEARLWDSGLIGGFEGLGDPELRTLLTVTSGAWNRTALPDSTRARAAWLHARALGRLGASREEQCIWARNAFELASRSGLQARAYRALTLGCGDR